MLQGLSLSTWGNKRMTGISDTPAVALNLKQAINIVAVPNEDQISEPEPENKAVFCKSLGIDPKRAWELANLIRIAGTDFKIFNDWFNDSENNPDDFLLEEDRNLQEINNRNHRIYVDKKITNDVIEEYFVINNKDIKCGDHKQFPESEYIEYEVLKTYEFLSYHPFRKQKIDIDRFGFIVEREVQGEKLIFIVFRGTRELAEWFNNSQFRQVDFLEIDKKDTQELIPGIPDYGKVSQGFNKMYTEFRPGVLNKLTGLNIGLRTLDRMARKYFHKIDKKKFKDKSIQKAITEFYESNIAKQSNTHIYITGHSLGGALATIAGLDLVASNLGLRESIEHKKIANPIHLYTFASPRVGNNIFAKTYNDLIKKGDIKVYRFANTEDLVTNIPFSVWLKAGVDLDNKLLLGLRTAFNKVTGGIFEADYQHVGIPICFTHQALRENQSTATVGDNHNMTRTYCGSLPRSEDICRINNSIL